jgi:ectoine hydroxylase-related dioxygenase (phytanoyl-CoA dioxygenase family)
MLLTKDQIDLFKRDGVLTLRGVFSPDEIDSWRRELLTFFENPKTGDQCRDALRTRKSHDFRFDHCPTPLAHSALSAVYGGLHGTLLWNGENELVVRAGDEPAPRLGARAPHLDFPVYAPMRTLANSTIYLSDVKEHSGSFIYWPGSHHIAWQYFRECPDDYLAQGSRSQDQVFGRIKARMTSPPVEFVGSSGDMMIWHSLILHSASVNKGSEARLALFGRWGAPLADGPIYDFNADMWRHWNFQQ